jgi:hypothetical protein
MNQVEASVLNKVIGVLNSLNLKFAIVDSDGDKHGELNIEQVKKPKRRRSIYPLGEVRGYIMPFMQNMMINSTKNIPVGKYAAEVLRGSVSSYATQMWGSGNYKTRVADDKKSVELVRFDPQVAAFMKNDPVADLLSGLDDLQTQPKERVRAFDIEALRYPRSSS